MSGPAYIVTGERGTHDRGRIVNVYHMQRWPVGSAQTGQIASMVVVAGRADQARRAASRRCGPEGPEPWLDAQRSTCKLVGLTRESVVSRAVQS